MSLRIKLTIGLGFLFLIIFALDVYGLLKIQELSKDADNILKDNYASLVYCKNMLLALDDIGNSITTGSSAKTKRPHTAETLRIQQINIRQQPQGEKQQCYRST